jgi:hypothetical protein
MLELSHNQAAHSSACSTDDAEELKTACKMFSSLSVFQRFVLRPDASHICG